MSAVLPDASRLVESPLDPEHARLDVIVPAGDGWLHRLDAGERLRIVDVQGNQAIDTLFYAAEDPADRYDATATIRDFGNVYLTTGARLMGAEGRPLVTMVADTCGRHDTLGGACSQESNVVRYGEHARHMHACRSTFLRTALAHGETLTKRDLAPNCNFFMNVPLTPEGDLTFADGISSPGRYLELRADRATTVLVSNCPQVNNPCSGYDPTPARMLIWDAAPAAAAEATA